MKKILIFMILVISVYANDIDKIKIYTENYPPYNMKINGVSQGIAIDILDAMLKQMNSKLTKKDIKIKPWATGYKIVSKKKNTMLFSTTRTKQREKLFKWVGPITTTEINLVTLNNSSIKVSDINDICKSHYKIGVVLNDVAQQVLLSKNISPKQIVTTAGKQAIVKNLKALLGHKIDIFACNFIGAKYSAKLNYIESNLFKKIFTVKKSYLYFAFNKNTNDHIIKEYQKALDTIKQNGIYDKILKKYR